MEVIHIISLGAGVQSSTMALMAKHGEITPMPACAIFADTQAEPASVYTWLDWLEKQLPFPVIRATAGNLADDSTRVRTSKKTGMTYQKPGLPVFTVLDGHAGMMQRQCTLTYKVEVVRRAARKVMKQNQSKKCIQWIGISRDEAHRMKPNRDKRFENIWPLIDKGVSRNGCLTWMNDHGYPTPPRSACVFCPYHSNEEWLRLKTNEPEAFSQAIEYERRLRVTVRLLTALSVNSVFLHRSLVPIDQVDFSEEDKQLSMFGNDCEGMCGV